jgi:transmembrane sensor
VTPLERPSRRDANRLRRVAAAWFARLRGPDAARHQAAFEAWRDADPGHRAAYDRLIAHWNQAAVLSDFASVADARPERRTWRTWRTWLTGLTGLPDLAAGQWRWPRAIALGAGLAAGVAAILWLGVQPQGLPLWGARRLETAVSEIRSVRLSDGSQVVLDTDTVVMTRLGPGDRRLDLVRGRARFDLVDDRRRPAIVAVAGRTVRARAAMFDIALSPERSVSIVPLRGDVELEPEGASRQPPLTLRPGVQWALRRPGTAARLGVVSPAEGLWTSGLLSFRSTPLSRAAAEANRYSRRKIVLADPAIGALEVSGVFKSTATATFAASLAAMFDLSLTVAPNGDFLLSHGQAT